MTTPLRKVRYSMAARIGFAIVPFVIFVFVLSLGYLFKWSRDMVRQEAVERAYYMLNNTSLRVAEFLNEVQTATNNMVWQIDANPKTDSLLAYSRRVVQLNNGIKGCSITMEPDLFPEGGSFFSAYSYREGDSVKTKRETPYDFHNEVWYKNSYTTGNAVWVDPYGSDDLQNDSTTVSRLITSYSVPLKDKQGQIIGVIATDLSLKRLSATISKEVPYENSYCIMLGKEGHFFVHTDTTKLVRKTIFDDRDPLSQADIITLGHEMLAGNSGYLNVKIDGDDCLVFYQPLENTPWSIALICKESDIFGSYNNLLYVLAPLLTIGLLLLLFFLRAIVNYFINPINRLASQTRHIADGHFDVTMPTSRRIDTIGRLQNNFSAMQQSLSKHISHLEQVNAETEQRNTELAYANQQADEAGLRQVAFLQNVLHQIRTPLNIIMGFVQVLRDDYEAIPREEIATITEAMAHNATTITRMVHMLTAASSLDVRKIVDCDDIVSCKDIINEALDIHYQRQSQTSPLQVEMNVADDLMIKINKDCFLKGLNEILFNAIKYGIVEGHESEATILLRVEKCNDGFVHFTVEDNGPGVPSAHHSQLFIPFFKGNSFSEGLGLGLYVSKQFANLMGGDLIHDESYTSGARFVLTIPAA